MLSPPREDIVSTTKRALVFFTIFPISETGFLTPVEVSLCTIVTAFIDGSFSKVFLTSSVFIGVPHSYFNSIIWPLYAFTMSLNLSPNLPEVIHRTLSPG